MDVFLAGFSFTFLSFYYWITSIFSLIGLYGTITFFFLFMRKNNHNLNNQMLRGKIGNLYEGLKPEGADGTIYHIEYHSLTFFLRRAAFVAITFMLLDHTSV